jgi:hypothetical protein
VTIEKASQSPFVGFEKLGRIVPHGVRIQLMKTRLQRVCSASLSLFLAMQGTLVLGQQIRSNAPGSAKKTITVKRGTQVFFRVQQPISSANAHNGQRVEIVVQDDVLVNGILAIPKGAEGTGAVFDAAAAIPGKRDGMLLIRPVDLTLPDGRHIKMSNNPPGYDDCDGIFGPCWMEYSLFAPVILPIIWGQDLADRHHTAEGKDVTETTTELIQGYTRQRFKVENSTQP